MFHCTIGEGHGAGRVIHSTSCRDGARAQAAPVGDHVSYLTDGGVPRRTLSEITAATSPGGYLTDGGVPRRTLSISLVPPI